MRQSVRALSWIITIGIILIALFLVSVVYSMYHNIKTQGISFGGFQQHHSEDDIILLLPFYVNNTGYYDLSDINLTTYVRDFKGAEISRSSTMVEEVKTGNSTTLNHNMSLSFEVLENLSYLLFEDGNFTVDTYVGMRYAHAFHLQLQIPNRSTSWGAPFYNFSIGEMSPPFFNETHCLLTIPISFENHVFFNVTGVMHLEILDRFRDHVGYGTKVMDVPPGSDYNGLIEFVVSIHNVLKIDDISYVSIFFENDFISFGPVEKPYG